MNDTELKKEATKYLKSVLKPGTKVYTITRHVSQSGMTRRISAFAIVKGELVNLDWYIEKIGLFKRHKTEEGLVIGGCGMDMHFHLVYELGSVLYPKGYKIPKGEYGRNGDTSGYETSGGYALKKVSM
jgi:hypothetical protein